ncbi:hypothetical protein SCAB_60991 [Streptomyces scabiei 87.22]|uniref:Uncharacterized protein n=1 Tax=Streptomyces scabiei (strain 87.22) TaxID=680198 RepID=C9Z930_STRSW|nr:MULTISPECIES: hypothetical protein [Streptomyces]MBP5875674.1 hypothetical protein [Streptomyces sp. LBUM 1477]MDX2652130.1 hypothetical protein [Streptomyces scabiei]MDX2725844.1 hypothetical protein [Streptomyces scabiei]MDX2863963.1 hypothetical protein [Streptomyces scabiei]MDX2881887.1 hypothetical protein [Streptomyces scabiei]
MANIVFNVALGRIAQYASLPNANDALVLVALEASGLVADSTMRDYDTLADVLAGASNEQTTVTRKTLSGVTVTVNDASDRVDIDAADVVYTSPTGNPVGAVVVCYDPDTTTGTDADLIPLTKHDLSWTPDGNTFTLTIADLLRASSAA